MVMGILVLLHNRKASANKTFFALIIAIVIWSAGLALATVASIASPICGPGFFWFVRGTLQVE
jgi:uncharacterized RDD family membrane protein YckC